MLAVLIALVIGAMPILVVGTLQFYLAIAVTSVMAIDGPWNPRADLAHILVVAMLNAQFPSGRVPSTHIDYNYVYALLLDRAIGFTFLSFGLWGANWLASVL